MLTSRVACVLDRETAKRLHARGRLWHDAFYPEVLDEMGVCCDVIEPSELEKRLGEYAVVLLTDFDAGSLGGLADWVRRGGTLLGFLTEGQDALFGVEGDGREEQADDDFTCSAYLRLLNREWLPFDAAYGDNIPILSPIRRVRMTDARAEANLLPPLSFNIRREASDGWTPLAVGLAERRLGKGLCVYFSFNLAQTVRAYQQGRPVDRDWDGDGMYRSGDGIVFNSAQDLHNPFGDYLRELLRRAFDGAGVLSKHVYPPKDGEMPDMVFYYGGDDECDPTGVQEISVRKMRDAGYPYHINIMCDAEKKGYALSMETFREMVACGQEPSIHFDFFRTRTPITKEEFTEQLDLFEKTFGLTPKVYVNHCVMFWGWTDLARWSAERGLKGDNGRFGTRLMPDPNPINSHGFAFGTSYPHFVYDDAAHGDAKLDFLYVPSCLYEPRVRADRREEDDAALEVFLSHGVDNAWIIPLFFHPVYVARCEEAWLALESAHEIARKRGWRCLDLGVDALADWWFDRSNTSLEKAGENRFTVDCPSPRGVTLRLPAVPEGAAARVDGKEAALKRRAVYGRECAFVTVPQGRHLIELTI